MIDGHSTFRRKSLSLKMRWPTLTMGRSGYRSFADRIRDSHTGTDSIAFLKHNTFCGSRFSKQISDYISTILVDL